MIGYYTILVLGCVGAVLGNAPPYVQSAEAFVYAKTFVSEKLPNRKMDIHNVQDRPHLSFAMLAGVTGGLLLLQDDSVHLRTRLEMVDAIIPSMWHNYDVISQRTLSLIHDATQKVALIVNLINSICGSANVEECNAEVDKKVKDSPFSYEMPANLLLSLGNLSVVIRDNEATINSIIENDNDIPYLIHNVESKQFSSFLELVQRVFGKLSELTYRRFLSDY
ncbi:uncharacterized protein LOC124542380 [Vanessa cardui]|uniref:uncharacterized protein LOC124542380 n=1 Tax=Vanessa cardui TaxID=171605 RepID=UPI001F12D741|nr:uncharacterized protein LOC124542380 [Vanessa cardui]